MSKGPVFNPLEPSQNDPPYFPFDMRCPRCRSESVLGYIRHLDTTSKEGRSIHLSSRKEGYSGTDDLKDYGGTPLYLGWYSGATGQYDVLACGNCWTYLLNNPTRYLSRIKH
jgi:hypothetical protein